MTHNDNAIESNLPTGLAKPAIRALSGAGYLRLEQFAKLTEAEVLQITWYGPKSHGSYP
ncbi:DNA-binding protein [Sporosarcina sp. ANT_H38]|uniref:DNA-binding protein n=1 Tax=Sporosarcina sp. ANT_H38 TaxID=2597358 RepID=UPI00351A4576